MGGFWYALRRELNLQIELLAGFLVIVTMLLLPVQKWEVVVLIIMITWVLVLEILNTLLERLVNLLKPRIHPYVGTLKDLMAAAVFVSAVGAAAVGLIIFWPYLF
jgi:diacylglycerol kinase